MNKSIYIQQLINARKLHAKEEYVLFEEALQALQASITVDDITEICKAFCDDTQDDEVILPNMIVFDKRKKYLGE